MTVFHVMQFALFRYFLGIMSEPGSPERPAPEGEAMESSPGNDQGDTPKKGRKKKGEKKPIPEMMLTVDV